jgi:hypothetical protein
MTGTAEPRGLPPFLQRIAPLAVLFLLAPWVGEYLLGNVPGTLIWALPILALMYGGGAILVREIALRMGLGWPGILLLAAAYGVIEAGLVDQSLFDPEFLADRLPRSTEVPALGISAINAVAFVAGHVVWSIGLPVAFAQFLFPKVAKAPWLGPWGWVLVGFLYLFGCWIILGDIRQSGGFIASDGQRIGAVAVALLFGAAALVLPRRLAGFPVLATYRPLWTGFLGFGLSGLMVLAPETWPGLGWKLTVLVAWAGLSWALCRHEGWTRRHGVAYAGGMLLTYAWLGPVLTMLVHGGGAALLWWNAGFAACAVVLIWLAWRRAGAG